tara:strand:- start:875 stop:1132 length:258 start_codon:yes stop_codon:yes gene_type:complete
MTPLEEQAGQCQTMALQLSTEIDEMTSLLAKWQNCDRSNEQYHWMHTRLTQWIEELNVQVEEFGKEVAEAELLEGLHESGQTILN